MQDVVVLSREEIEDALIRYIGLKRGQSFFPYKITKATGLSIYGEATLEIEIIPKGAKSSERKVVL